MEMADPNCTVGAWQLLAFHSSDSDSNRKNSSKQKVRDEIKQF